jgi:hypothetical protein
MKTSSLIYAVITASLIFLLSSCKDPITEISVNAQTGNVSFVESTANTLRMNKPVQLTVTNVRPNEFPIFSVEQKYVDIANQPELSSPVSDIQGGAEAISKAEEKGEGTTDEKLITVSKEIKKALTDLLNAYTDLRLKYAVMQIEDEKTALFTTITTSRIALQKQIDLCDTHKLVTLKEIGDKLMIDYMSLSEAVLKHQFLVSRVVIPTKELVSMNIQMAKLDEDKDTLKRPLFNADFAINGSFKLVASVGFHTLISDGANVREFANKDSIIVDRKGANVIPAFGTYLSGVWRYNQTLYGIGFGTGIPLASDDANLTPNFTLHGTLMWQSDMGRFGVNLGVGLRKINYLAPGYEMGEKLSDATQAVPTYSRWRPALMIGVSYTIPQKK